jgi:hypothetical protein
MHAGEGFDGMSHKRPRLEIDSGEAQWADLQPDVLGVVLRLLPCLPDRASGRCAATGVLERAVTSCPYWCDQR